MTRKLILLCKTIGVSYANLCLTIEYVNRLFENLSTGNGRALIMLLMMADLISNSEHKL